MNKNINIIIMGPQGSGKGTQARILAEKYDLQLLEAGNLLRNAAREETELGREIDEIINKKGEVVPLPLLAQVIEKKMSWIDKNKGVLFDGIPRTMEQASYLENILEGIGRKIDYIFFIDISKNESVKRISIRKMCRENGHPLIVGKDIGEEDDKCPICGSEIYRREDDTPEKVLKRLAWNEKLVMPVVQY
ncbi:MAG: nucleoside monophosphate kinase, partial [Minisyncoccia bacterium]